MKKYVRSFEDVRALLKDGYKIVSIAYFVDNMIPQFILEK